jgi:hypothetical protein
MVDCCQLLCRAGGVADGGHDEVLEALDVVRVDRLRVDLDERTSPLPVTVAVTRPPPAVPDTSVLASCSCASSTAAASSAPAS